MCTVTVTVTTKCLPLFWSVKVIFLLSYHYGEIKLPSQGFGTETWLPQFRKKSQNKINFFKVREKSGNFSLIRENLQLWEKLGRTEISRTISCFLPCHGRLHDLTWQGFFLCHVNVSQAHCFMQFTDS